MPKDRLHTNIDKAEQAKKVLEANPLFQRAVFEFQGKWHLSENNEDRETNLSRLSEAKYFSVVGKRLIFSYRYIKKGTLIYEDVLKILKQFNLSEYYWFGSVSCYLMYNKFPSFHSADTAETEPAIIEKKDPTSKLPIIYLRLGRNTTLDDIKDSWSLVRPSLTAEEDQDTKHRHNPRKNAGRDSDIFKLYQRKRTTEEIARAILAKYGQDVDHGNIKKIISIMKKHLGIKDQSKLLTSKIKRKRLP